MAENKRDRLSLLAFVGSLTFFVFLYGVGVGSSECFPYAPLNGAFETLKAWLGFAECGHHLYPVRYDRTGARRIVEPLMSPGVTLITSHFDGTAGIRLIDAQGNVLHAWRTNAAEIWPKTPHDDLVAGERNVPHNYVHGTYLFENGDVLFSMEYMGLVRMTASGEVLWRLPRRTHHSVTRDEDGNFWVCAMRWLEEGNPRLEAFPGLEAPLAEDQAIKVSPDGQILKEFSVLEALVRSGDYRLVWKTGQRSSDLLHLNDVEPLSSAMAPEYPLFEAGDLVVSMRWISAVAVLDGQDGHVKWFASDPFLWQHDPDFIGNGWIRVFDNNADATNDGRWLGGSRIVDIRPHTGERRVVLPTPASDRFYTMGGGKCQSLPNGNLLITEARAGRVFEVDPSGRTVWEWIQTPYEGDPSFVAEVLEGTRYNITPETVKSWKKDS